MQPQVSTTGSVAKIIYTSPEQQVINVKTKSNSIKVLINKHLDYVEVRDHIHIVGIKERHQKYGEQVVANEISHCPISVDLLKDFLTLSSGIGGKIAERLIIKFGDDLVNLIENRDIDKLSSINRVSKSLAITICNSWHKQAGKLKLIQFINEIMVNQTTSSRQEIVKIAKSSYSFYGEHTVDRLKEDPYRIWAFSNFKKAEILAKALNIESSDKRRLFCAVEEVLFKALHQGSTRLSPDSFAKTLDELIGPELTIPAIFAAFNQSNSSPARFVVTQPENTVHLPEAEQLYLRKIALPAAAEMENYIMLQLLSRVEAGISPIQVTNDYLDNYLLPNSFRLSNNQKAAVRMVLENSISSISGGAGTGKTSVLYCIHDIVNSGGGSILQIALSGKATRRLAQQTNQDAMTIEALLKKVEKYPDFLNAYTVPLILIDEASMVDLQSMYRVLIALKNKPARIVFVGDQYQLPPVGPGLIYHPLMSSDKVMKVELTDNFRSVKEISDAASCIKQGVAITPSKNVKIIQATTESLLDIAKRQYELSLHSESVHIIAARLKTVSALNISLHNSLMKNRKVIPSAPEFKVGDSVIYKKNNDELGIVNGSTGKVLSGDEASITIEFDCEGVVTIPADCIADQFVGEYYLHHAYAITCHSAQGSEFETVIVVVEDIPMVERSWLYTSLTRAQKQVILITYENSIVKALERGFKIDQIDVGFEL